MIDDHPMVRSVLRRGLESMGHSVHEAEDGRAGMALLAHLPVDLVVTDILMPEADGIEVLRSVRRATPRTRVVVITGLRDGGAGRLDNARAFGADAVLCKPFTLGELRETVEALLLP